MRIYIIIDIYIQIWVIVWFLKDLRYRLPYIPGSSLALVPRCQISAFPPARFRVLVCFFVKLQTGAGSWKDMEGSWSEITEEKRGDFGEREGGYIALFRTSSVWFLLIHIEISRHHKTPIIEFRGRQEIYVWYLEASSITWLTPQSDDLYGGHVFVAQPVGLQVRGRGYIYIIIYIWLNNIKYILHM